MTLRRPSLRLAARLRRLRLLLMMPLIAGCAQPGPAVEGPTTTACGRIRFIADGQEVTWGAVFDRPAPELYRVESGRFINRIELAGGGLLTETVERDGSFCWQLAPGTYFISRIYPFQDDSLHKPDDPAKNVFPGIALRLDASRRPAYLGTLRIAVSVRKDFMGNRRMTSRPVIAVEDEFERERTLVKDRRGLELEPRLMVRVPEIEGRPFHPDVPDLPAVLRAVPWFLLGPVR